MEKCEGGDLKAEIISRKEAGKYFTLEEVI